MTCDEVVVTTTDVDIELTRRGRLILEDGSLPSIVSGRPKFVAYCRAKFYQDKLRMEPARMEALYSRRTEADKLCQTGLGT